MKPEWKPGARVQLKDDTFTGRITRIEGNLVWFEDADGFEYQARKEDLILLGNVLDQVVVGPYVPQQKEPSSPKTSRPHKQQAVLDLHAEKLGLDYLEPAEILPAQLRELKNFLERMKNKHYKSLLSGKT